MTDQERPRVGVGVLIIKDGKVLLGKRKGGYAADVFAGPGGHLEHMESFEACAKREATEEAGVEIGNVRFLCLSNFQKYAPKCYVDIGLVADWVAGEPEVREPDKCAGWAWYSLDQLPSPLFGVVEHYMEARRTGRNYFDV